MESVYNGASRHLEPMPAYPLNVRYRTVFPSNCTKQYKTLDAGVWQAGLAAKPSGTDHGACGNPALADMLETVAVARETGGFTPLDGSALLT